ncbi:MAG: minor capsid protein [Ramlibacter sp.]|nr:minor capsid protein [Ramlibacter sp.]
MPTPLPKGLRLGLIEPRDAVAAFERRQLLLPSFRWDDVWQQEHARGVAVAGVMKFDVLQVFADELASSQAAGGDLRAFRQAIQPRLEKAGYWGDVEISDPRTGEVRTTRFNKARLELIFDVNTRQSYAAGRWERIERNKARKPFILYLTMKDERVRASHRAWHGVVLPVDSPFWETHYPPNGWRCRCIAIAVDEKDIARYIAAGFDIKRDMPEVALVDFFRQSTDETLQVPRGIDPGFAYNPGKRPYAGVSMRELGAGVLSLGAAGTPATWRLPPPRPAPAGALLPEGKTAQEYLDAFMAEFAGPEFVDVLGEPLLITDELFRDIRGNLKVTKRGRERFLRLLAMTIKDPDEIWMASEMHHARGADVARRRYVARWQVEGQEKPVLGVFELGRDGWRGVTGFQAETPKDAADLLGGARKGEIVYRRAK